MATGMPVTSEAIVGNRRAGATVVADHVTAPPFTNDDNTGMAPAFKESWPSPSSTNKMTCSARCSVDGAAGAPAVPRAAKADEWDMERTNVPTRAIDRLIRAQRTGLIDFITCLTTGSR
ncbi:MAG: hypothetical protein AMXMBFR67_18930 [Nitrospira sp.]